MGKKENLSQETLQKMSDSKKGEKNPFYGRKHSEATKEKIRSLRIGKKTPDYVKKKISDSLSGEKNPNFGKPLKPNVRESLLKANIGRTPPNKGVPMSEEAKRNLSEKMMGKIFSPETRLKISESNKRRHGSLKLKGIPRTDDVKKRISESKKGIPRPRDVVERVAASHRGKRLSEQHKQKIRDSHLGERCYLWQGGASFEPYCLKFNNGFKRRVRAYWGDLCFECGTPGWANFTKKGKLRKLIVHHIHYDKKMCCNGSPRDVILLCQSCHSKTNHDRDFWEKYFTELLYLYSPEGKCFFTEDEMVLLFN
jgi:5-methylcytosine-specific restriction endonuclease McrA